jgi:NADPH:quinone reductase-like Zn-dependent oxidoreductase
MPANTPAKMKAIAIDRFGGAEEMKRRELPVPEVDAGEVLIRVEFAGVGVWDPFERQGGFHEMLKLPPRFPHVLGSDGAGTVVAVGRDVRDLKVGDRAYGVSLVSPKGGFYAEYAAVKAEYASRVPGALPTEQAAIMPVDAVTALRGLEDNLGLKAGETIMVFGAGGGIGHLAVQLAKAMGAKVFAVASGADGVALAQRLGADAAVDGRKGDVAAAARKFASGGVDSALLTAGGAAADAALAAVRPGGRVAFPNGVEPAPRQRPGLTFKQYDGWPDATVIAKLNRLIESGPFEAHVARTFPLEQAAAAHRALDEHYLGKLALRVAAA